MQATSGSIIGRMRSVAAGKPILVVEDEHNIASLLKLYLGNEGFSVAWVADGAKALDEADRLDPALVILDLMLPGLDGLEICRRLRSRSRVPVIMLTARDSEIDRIVGLELGADDYITKPGSRRSCAAPRRRLVPARPRVTSQSCRSAPSSSILPGGRRGPGIARWSSRPRSSTCWPS